ncbi:hypothetical protein CAPN001_12830 [Capnocytophaga stomatis]|uniref:Heme-binding protein HmuY n=1 Tax=Capnocytophaga stomatis TaxID=1848904 RepID=A0A250FYU2_9FLAO|nr:HmuY family protein [Capnocytophaga stomatis]ATA89127.1 heme-binding protein HmuY [Capnocytophaga stomatis]GIJ96714.1 hypothetical protein CAPN001_12830 [Capnocytophaga stomatis]GIM48656.1 hypothetical protein CAPN003_01080 [Capnocytophaga stomatis]
MKRIFITAILVATGVLVSCKKDEIKKDDEKPSLVAKEIKSLDATTSKDWVYFSFEKGTVVQVSNPKESADWDIAFSEFYIKTNGGESGKGKAEVALVESKEFDAVKEAPTQGYVKDIEGDMMYGYPPVTKKGTFSALISGGFDSKTGYVSLSPKNIGTWPSVYAPTKNVYVVKTADGKFVKIQITDFYNDKAKAGYLTFRYVTSQDGKF